MKCVRCEIAIDPKTAWLAAPDIFYCSEFCAEIEENGAVAENDATALPSPRKSEIDRQYLERLERLLPYFKHAHTATAAPTG